MKKFIFTLLFFVQIGFADEIKKPALEIVDPFYNFGTVLEGAKVSHDFKIINRGNGDLVIERAVPGCGCTVASLANQIVAPGSSALVHVEFDTAGFSGEKNKSVRLYTNDPQGAKELKLSGKIEPEILISPRNVIFNSVVRSSSGIGKASAEVDLAARADGNLKIGELKSYSDWFDLKLLSKSEKRAKVLITLKPDVTMGEHRDRVIVKLENGRTSAVNIPVYALVESAVSLKPRIVSFGVITGSQPLSKVVKLEGEQGIKIDSIVSDNSAITSSFEELKPGKSYKIKVMLDPSKVTKDLKAELKVKTTGSEAISLNVYGLLPTGK